MPLFFSVLATIIRQLCFNTLYHSGAFPYFELRHIKANSHKFGGRHTNSMTVQSLPLLDRWRTSKLENGFMPHIFSYSFTTVPMKVSYPSSIRYLTSDVEIDISWRGLYNHHSILTQSWLMEAYYDPLPLIVIRLLGTHPIFSAMSNVQLTANNQFMANITPQ